MGRMPETKKQKMYIWTTNFYRIKATGIIISIAFPCVRGMSKYFNGGISEVLMDVIKNFKMLRFPNYMPKCITR